MNPRERMLVIVLLTLLVGAGGFFFVFRLYLAPLQEVKKRMDDEGQEIQKKQLLLDQARADQTKLQRFRQMSLPANPEVARREYENYLTDLMLRSGFAASSFTVTPRNADARTSPTLTDKKKPAYTRLTFTAEGTANLKSLVKMMEEFYQAGFLHQIKTISVQRPSTTGSQQKAGELVVNMTIEALILSGADDRKYLLPNIDRRYLASDVVAGLQHGPVGLGAFMWAIGPTGPHGPDKLATMGRHYEAIAAKDIFFGPPAAEMVKRDEEIDFPEYVYLDSITDAADFFEATLYDRLRNKSFRLRASAGRDQFRVTDDQGKPAVQGKVVKIDKTDIILLVDDKQYSMHVGQNLTEALQQPLDRKRTEARPGPGGPIKTTFTKE